MTDARLVPELICADFARSLAFYIERLGFVVRYTGLEERLAYPNARARD